jgi:1-acyl-sn-glycerol-3-phosphate acyltransferase
MRLYWACWWIAYGLSRFFFRIRTEGRKHVPANGGLILASNHCSYADPVLIGVAARRELLYVTKQEVFAIPFLGWLVRNLNAMPIDRSRGDRGGLMAIETRLEHGGAMFLSPEGTRNKTGRFLKPKAGVGMMVYRTRVPVVPVYISGTVNVWKSLIGLSQVVVKFGEPIRFHPDRLPSRRKEAYYSISSEVMHKIGDLKRGGRNAGTVASAPVVS